MFISLYLSEICLYLSIYLYWSEISIEVKSLYIYLKFVHIYLHLCIGQHTNYDDDSYLFMHGHFSCKVIYTSFFHVHSCDFWNASNLQCLWMTCYYLVDLKDTRSNNNSVYFNMHKNRKIVLLIFKVQCSHWHKVEKVKVLAYIFESN